MESKIISIYTTWPDSLSAKGAAQTLINENLIACANVINDMTSMYNWNGNLQEDSEVIMILKTQKSLFAKTSERVQALHPYEVPCICALPVSEVSESYEKWIFEQTHF